MAKTAKAAAKTVKTSAVSKKITAKQPVSRKAAAKKTAAPKKRTLSGKKAAAKKTAVKPAPAKKTAAKKAAPKKAGVKKAGAKKSPPQKMSGKRNSKKSPAPSKAKMPGETTDTGEFADSTGDGQIKAPVTNSDINNEITPESEQQNAVFAGAQPDQQYMPEALKATPHDPYHGNLNPSKSKGGIKPSGKKPLWDSGK